VLALVLALLLTAVSLAEGQLAVDLSGGLMDDYSDESRQPVYEAPQAYDVFDAELSVGYVAQFTAMLNPFWCNEWDLVSLNQLVFESVIALNEEQKPVPMLADNWTHNNTEWVFNLRKGITFHNGAELTAYDVEASYRQFAAGVGKNPYTARINQFIEDMAAIDTYTLAVKSHYSGYLTLYAMNFPVVQMSTLYDEMPRGTGPYWYVSYEMDEHVRIEANPLWWKQQPTHQSIVFRHYNDAAEAIEGLQTREVDMLSTRSSSAALSRRLANLTAMDYGTMTYEMMVPNLSSDSPLADVNVRQAVMYAIDRSVLASNAYLDMAIQSEVPVLPGTWLYESQSAKYYYSPERALQLLYSSGWADLTGDTYLNKLEGMKLHEIDIEILTYNDESNSVRENAANLIAEYLNAVGIKAAVTVVTRSEMSSRLKKQNFDLALIGVNLSEIPVLQPLLGTGGALNYNKYSDGNMDTYIGQTAMYYDEATIRNVYSDIQLKVVAELPIMGLLFRTGTVLSTRSLGGLNGISALNNFRGMEYLNE